MSHERRDCRRWAVPAERREVTLKIGRKLVPGRLVDVSAGGFAIQVASNVPVETGAQIEVLSCDGIHLVQVVHTDRKGELTFLGLQRVADAPIQEVRRRGGRHVYHFGNPLFIFPVVAGMIVCAAVLLSAWRGPDWVAKAIIRPAVRALSH